MQATDNRQLPPTPASSSRALTILTAIVYIIGFAMVSAWFALLVLGQPRQVGQAPDSRSAEKCSVCGVVERVGEFKRASLQITGDQAEGFVVLLAALGGGLKYPAAAAGTLYETFVLHDDGSVRIVRDSSAPQWKRGDRVKVIKGRIEPSADVIGAPLKAVPVASQAERTLSPALPATLVQ
jgi:hypothetical protein